MAANGSSIANEGGKKLNGITDEGIRLDMTWQVADVKKPLASVGRICDAGNLAVFTRDGGYVVPEEHAEGMISRLEKMDRSTLRMRRENGTYNFNLWVPAPPKDVLAGNRFQELQEVDEEEEPDFQRQGARLM